MRCELRQGAVEPASAGWARGVERGRDKIMQAQGLRSKRSAWAMAWLLLASSSASAGEGKEFFQPTDPGPFAVAGTTVIVEDPSRPFDAWGEVNAVTPEYRALLAHLNAIGETNRISVRLYYPTEPAPGSHPGLAGSKARPASPLPAARGRRATLLDLRDGDRAEFDRINLPSPRMKIPSGESLGAIREANPDRHAALVQEFLDQKAARPLDHFMDAACIGGPHPLVVFSHGGAGEGTIGWATTRAEHLASHGYVVAVPAHTADSQGLIFHVPNSTSGQIDTTTRLYQDAFAASGGDPEAAEQAVRDAYTIIFTEATSFFDKFSKLFAPPSVPGGGIPGWSAMMQGLFRQRVADVKSIIEDVEARNATAGDLLEGCVDVDRVGMVGQSLGSITSQVALALLDEVDVAYANNDGIPKIWEPPPMDTTTHPIDKPVILTVSDEDDFTRSIWVDFIIFGFGSIPGNDWRDVWILPSEQAGFPPTRDRIEMAASAVFERSVGPTMLLVIKDSLHGARIGDGDNRSFPMHLVEENGFGLPTVDERMPFGEDVFDPDFVGEPFIPLGFEPARANAVNTDLPAEIHNHYIVSLMGYFLKNVDQYRNKLLHDPFGDLADGSQNKNF